MQLSRPTSTQGRLQRALLALLERHQAEGTLPTSGRFLWYELVANGTVNKTEARGHLGIRRGVDQDVSDALTYLREQGIVPWAAIADETRSLETWAVAPTIRQALADAIDQASLDPWTNGPAPLLLVESRSLAGALRDLAATYRVPLAALNGQAAGFLHVELAPIIGGRRVLYLGDWDLSGGHIEANARRVLADYDPGLVDRWERLALTDDQVDRYRLPVVEKWDQRTRSRHPSVETEALSQAVIVGIVQGRLDDLLPEPLSAVLVRERAKRAEAERLLADRL
jgi:hypothetical protein